MKCRLRGTRIWTEVDEVGASYAAATFAEDNELTDDDIVEVSNHGEFTINVAMEPEYFAYPVAKKKRKPYAKRK